MLEALTSNSPGHTPGKLQYDQSNPGGVDFKLPQQHLLRMPEYFLFA